MRFSVYQKKKTGRYYTWNNLYLNKDESFFSSNNYKECIEKQKELTKIKNAKKIKEKEPDLF